MESRLKRIVLTLLLLAPLPSVWAQEDDKRLLEDIVSPDIKRRKIEEDKIDSENIEIGFFAGVKSVEDFGTNDVYGGRIALHITEDIFLEANLGLSTIQKTSYELLSGGTRLLSDSERELKYYNLSLGYNFMPGEIFIRNWAFSSNFYLVGGAGNTLFANNEYFTYHFGAGLRVFVTDWVALRTDFRNHIMTHAIFGDDKEIQNIELLVGATVFF